MDLLSIKKCLNLTDTIKNSRLTLKKKMTTTKLWYSSHVSNLVIWEELLKLERMNITWSWSMIIIPQHTLNGSILECRMSRNSQLISSILSILSSQKVLITKEWNHCFTPRKKPSRMKELAMDGIVMEQTFATSQTHLKRRVEASTILLPSKFNLCMTMMRSTQLIVTLTLILTAQSFLSDYVSQRKKIELERLLSAKQSQEMIVKWPLLQTSALGLKKLPFEGLS